MVAGTSSWGSKVFPEIHICVAAAPRSSSIVVPPVVQAAALAAIVAGAVAICCLGLGRIGDDRLIAEKEAAVLRTETANADLQDDIAHLQDKLAIADRSRAQAENRLAALASQAGTLRGLLYTAEARLNTLDEARTELSQQRGEIQQQLTVSEQAASSKTGRIAQLAHALDLTRRELHQAAAESATLTARLSKADADRAQVQAQYGQYKASLDETAKELRQLAADRDTAAGERDRLRARLGELEQKLSQRGTSPAPPPRLAAAMPPLAPQPAPPPPRLAAATPPLAPQPAPLRPAPAEPIPPPPPAARAAGSADTAAIEALGHQGISGVEHVLASTGVDVARLFAQFGLDRAEGGPFVPPPKGGRYADAISPQKLAAMRGLARSLPLAAPVARYQIGSPFGPRIDPFNGRASFHTGVDFDAPYMSPVCATAAGTVIYAGYRGDYGKVVEIDHGNGIDTVYAHLHRYTVSVGERVGTGTQIGFLGSSGRSSGPHLHYEVLVNGEPQDPEKFIGLARLIPVAAR